MHQSGLAKADADDNLRLRRFCAMTIHLPENLESSILAAVQSGRFASVDDAMTEAARLLLQSIKQGQQTATPTNRSTEPDPLLGWMRDAADELDDIVAEAM